MDQFFPEIRAVCRSDCNAKVVLSIHVHQELSFFPGHFPGAPVLPGVVEVDWAIRLARRYFCLQGTFFALENLKFQHLILPGAEIGLHLHWQDKKNRQDQQTLDFMFCCAQRKYASGRVIFK